MLSIVKLLISNNRRSIPWTVMLASSSKTERRPLMTPKGIQRNFGSERLARLLNAREMDSHHRIFPVLPPCPRLSNVIFIVEMHN